jgi:hypothetical protein
MSDVKSKQLSCETTIVLAINIPLGPPKEYNATDCSVTIENVEDNVELINQIFDDDKVKLISALLGICAGDLKDRFPEAQLLFTPVNGIVPFKEI